MKPEDTYRDKSWMREQYVEQEKLQTEIADECGVSNQTISTWLTKFDIARDTPGENTYRDKSWMREQYVEQEKSAVEIADECGVSDRAIGKWLTKHDLETRGGGRVPDDETETLRDAGWLREQYVAKQMSMANIADGIGCDPGTVNRWLDEHEIETRSQETAKLSDEQLSLLRDKSGLCRQYVENRKTTQEIGDEIGVSYRTVAKWLDSHGIERRSNSEAQLDDEVSDKHRTAEWLQEKYVEERQTTQEIAETVGVDSATICRWLDRHEIDKRGHSEALADGTVEPLRDAEWVRKEYVEQEKSQQEIADELGINSGTVGGWMQKHGIETRSPTEVKLSDEQLRSLQDEDWLCKQYVENHKTTQEIGDEIGVAGVTVSKWLGEYDIETPNVRAGEFSEEFGHVIRSGWERKVAKELVNLGVDYRYEDEEIDLPGGRTYEPDFSTDTVVIECKGAHWGEVYDTNSNTNQKAQAAMDQLDDREYVVVGVDVTCDHHYSWDEREQLAELFE